MTSDYGMLQDRRRVAEEVNHRRDSQTYPQEKGGKHSGVSKFTTARKTTTNRDIAICLVNFYTDL